MILCCLHTSVTCPAFIIGPPFSSRWEQVQGTIVRCLSEKTSKLEVSIGSLTFEIREHQGRVPGKSVGVRGDGEHQENMAYHIN